MRLPRSARNQTVSKFKNLKNIDNKFPFKAKIEAKWHLRYSFIVKIMYLFPISKSSTLLRHSLNDKVDLMNQAPTIARNDICEIKYLIHFALLEKSFPFLIDFLLHVCDIFFGQVSESPLDSQIIYYWLLFPWLYV